MKWTVWGSEAGIFLKQIKQQGFNHAMRAILWRLRMATAKLHLQAQEKLGWYRYSDWIRDHERGQGLTPEPLLNPQLSYFVQISASSQSYLKDTLDSLVKQSYSHWKAYVYSTNSETPDTLINFYQHEPRIHWLLSAQVSPQFERIREQSGDWLGFLNAGDILSTHALAFFVSQMELHPDATIVYSDADKLTPDGLTRHDPSFWPDWSPELLLSVNYLTRGLFRRAELLKAAANAVDLEEAILRGSEGTGRIIHIPQVLCHVRDGQTFPWFADIFHPNNLKAHLERSGLQGVTVQNSSTTGTPQFTWAYAQTLVSIIILSRDQVGWLKRCIDSILTQTTYPHYEIILIENNSRERETFSYYEQLKSIPQVKVFIHNQAFNYSAFNNWGVQHAQGDLLLFLNNDIECIDPGWLDELARWACRPEVGIVGAKLLYPDHTIQHAGLVVGLEGHANHIFAGCQEGYGGIFGSVEWYRDYSAVTGACMMMRKAVYEQVGGFDENYLLAFNDIEICLRTIQAGYRVVYTPFARLIHHEGATRSTYKPAADISLASQHLKPLIEQGDPFFNPNLSLMSRIPTLHRRGELSAIKKLELISEFLS
ncbi:MAG: hypothetical protein A2030_06840 [Chloroflexi bacterium RBG_19FT_COMBO_50_10]|nr:MAG: hypothetical protein A2Y53_06900 [Chloroflexi bacterium RBG_16_47_49]OGO66113.1 MAG: hypothetical protein A2030_06840 [Chloroflexi bacterium RBG_19FT_COMBO_50_10]